MAYKMTILGSDIVGEVGEFASYFKDTVLNIIGLSVKLFGTILGQGVRIKNKTAKKTKRISRSASTMLGIIKSVEYDENGAHRSSKKYSSKKKKD